MKPQARQTPAHDGALLKVKDLACAHGDQRVFAGVSFTLEAGEIGALLGPSGTGKTTLLRALAGLHPVAAGRVLLRGEDMTAKPPEKRRVGLVFQDLALFPHLDVAGNIGFGLSRWPRAEREARVSELLARTGLTGMGARLPHELSGGQQQRVALARSLAPRPDLLLLDEPLSSLDADLRPRLRDELRALLKAEGTAALLVTHDQDEAFAFAEVVGVMLDGQLVQWAPGYELYHRPASAEVARFVGEGRLLPARGEPGGTLSSAVGRFASPALAEGETGWLLLRPDDVLLGDGPIEATVVDVVFQGAESMHALQLDDGTRLQALAPSHRQARVGDRVRVCIDSAHVVVFTTN